MIPGSKPLLTVVGNADLPVLPDGMYWVVSPGMRWGTWWFEVRQPVVRFGEESSRCVDRMCVSTTALSDVRATALMALERFQIDPVQDSSQAASPSV